LFPEFPFFRQLFSRFGRFWALLMDPAWVLKAQNGVAFEAFDITAYGRLD
jgi:hypothetical protein